MTGASGIPSRQILGVRVDAIDYARATKQVLDWARAGESRYVCLGTVNHIMEARQSEELRAALRQASLVTSDGMPLVWLLRMLGVSGASRVYGPDLTLEIFAAAAREGIAVGFYGGTPGVLGKLCEMLETRFPGLDVAYAEAPPFRELSAEEDGRVTESIERASVRILFVGLGTPKQDRWMHAHQGRVRAVMLGVGAAFDFLSGAKPQAPRWMQRYGIEWLFRLVSEPRRLGPRYLSQNPRFAVLAMAQLIRMRLHEHRR
jgi:N-acetylglucosaminyldiphosphoundecaprenol N-acetyl-beta-D-mannosaminyltransferase